MDIELLACNLVMGTATGGIAWFGRGHYVRVIDFVERDLAARLRTMRYSTARLRSLLHAWLASAVVVLFGLWFGFDSLVFGVLAAVFLLAGPWYVVRRMAQRRQEKLEDQLADAMVMFSSGVRPGLSIAQSLDLLARECPKPIRDEFLQVVGEYRLGKPLERTLSEAKERLRSENFILFAAALLASRESGGRLNDTVERISRSVLELQRLERKVKSETAQARKSAVYMAIMPVIILVVYSQIDPENTSLLFRTPPGQLVLAAVIVLNVVAYFWAVKILNPDI